jgi:hypothetical protein
MRTLLFMFLFLIAGCQEKNYYDVTGNRPTPLPTPTTPTTPVTQVSRIEYRVNGNALSARVRFTNAVDGTTLVTTTLPYTATITTTDTSMFLSLEATPISYPFTNNTPFMSAQIFVNGILFRESISEDYSYAPVTISGTWRK